MFHRDDRSTFEQSIVRWMGPFLRLLHVCRGYSLYILILCLFFQIYVRSKYLVTCIYIFRLVSCFINATTTNAIVVALTKYGNISNKKLHSIIGICISRLIRRETSPISWNRLITWGLTAGASQGELNANCHVGSSRTDVSVRISIRIALW